MARELEYPIALSVCRVVFSGSLGLSFGFFKMASSIFIAHMFVILSLEFSCLIMFCKSYRYSKQGKMLSCGKLIIINFTPQSDIDIENRQVSQVLLMIHSFFIFGWVARCIFLGHPGYFFYQNWSPSKLISMKTTSLT